MINSSLLPLVSLFNYGSCNIEESIEEVTICLLSDSYKALVIGPFISTVNLINKRDQLLISFFIGDGDPKEFSTGSDASEFIKDVDRLNAIRQDEEIKVVIKIFKNQSEGIISVYDYAALLTFLEKLSIQAILLEFNRLIKKVNLLIFEHQSDEKVSKSKSIWFVNKDFSGQPDQIERNIFINKAKTSCHYNFLAEFVLVPQDFFLNIEACARLTLLFNRLAIINAIVFLFDITVINDSNLNYKINGYKSITGDTDLNDLPADQENQYFKIYDWVYDSGNFNDKIGLARNIISLHLDGKDKIELKGDPFQSIQSSYKVYEKQNIKQYVEIRNKISDQLLSFHDRANKIIETFASGFQKSALALITFYTSAIVLKILNKDKLIEVFTIDAALLSTGFILCSAGYFFLSKWEVNAQRKRFEQNYADIKKRYADLLDEQDIERILNNDNEFKNDLKFMIDKGRNYTLLWFYFLIILLIITWLSYFIYNSQLFIEMGSFFQYY
ncbi:hypothetical protein J7E50_08345 [Pedobacter sp. ISL-68]|uniref:hypothetical protein n=1 Tax=unclassified Pedobacter TaxID=2628915 RepID=UPI001BE7EDF7|nr:MULTISPECIES: hypothetical protein [unclassified Pedobacter]MBT2560843.1 hypothetical protein [Pedobacter sp. ISL-64]MBT2590222.1 hypothetical protein [Pedobacter sp. ISL-68]